MPPASFRFQLTMDTLALGYVIPAIRAYSGLAPVRQCSCRAYYEKRAILTDSPSFIIQKHYEFYLISEQDSIYCYYLLFTNLSKSFKSAISQITYRRSLCFSRCKDTTIFWMPQYLKMRVLRQYLVMMIVLTQLSPFSFRRLGRSFSDQRRTLHILISSNLHDIHRRWQPREVDATLLLPHAHLFSFQFDASRIIDRNH